MSKFDEKPIQYQRGWVEFYKLKFKLTEDVLIPRPETELLVDEVLGLVRSWELGVRSSKNQKPQTLNPELITILDIGTGSGNIAIAVAKNLPLHLRGRKVKIIATEVSEKALRIAKQNARFHQVEEEIEFVVSDTLSSLSDSRKVDIVVTNLPYIPTERINYLDPSVKDFEPRVALDGGQDGFELYRKLFAQMKEKNIIPRYLIGEIDYTHGDLAEKEVKKFFPNAEVEVKFDLAHKQRILIISF